MKESGAEELNERTENTESLETGGLAAAGIIQNAENPSPRQEISAADKKRTAEVRQKLKDLADPSAELVDANIDSQKSHFKIKYNSDTEKPAVLEEEVSAAQRKFLNKPIETFFDEGIAGGIANLKTLLDESEIKASDEEQIKKLEEKDKAGKLTDKEREELEIRTSGKLLGYSYEYKTGEQAWSRLAHASVYKESYFIRTDIEGIQNGKQLFLVRHELPQFDKNTSRSYATRTDIFYVSEWKGKKTYIYEGEIDDKAISDEQARELFMKYSDVAQKRFEELKALKKAKEMTKLGRHIREPRYRWQHQIIDTTQ